MKKFKILWTTQGTAVIEANSLKEAQDMADKGDFYADLESGNFSVDLVEAGDNADEVTKPSALEAVIVLQAGLIRDVYTTGKTIDYVLVDLDTDGAEEDEITLTPFDKYGGIPDHKRKRAKGFVSRGASALLDGGTIVADAFKAAEGNLK